MGGAIAMKTPSRSFFSYSIVFSWLVLCIALSIVANRFTYLQGVYFPDDLPHFIESLARIQPIKYILDMLFALLGVTVFTLAAFSFGLGILRWREVSLARGVTAFALGEYLFSMIYLTVISFFRLTPVFTGAVLFFGFLLGVPILKHWIIALVHSHVPGKVDGWEKITLVLIFIILLLTVTLSSARLGFDSVVEYFSHAKIMAITGERVFFYPEDHFLVSSFHPGILFTAIIQLFGDQSARLLSWVNGLVILLTGLAIGKKLNLSARARLCFIILALTSTFFVDLLGDGKIELMASVPMLVAIYWMLESLEHPSKSMFLVIGALTGLTIISRPYNIFLVPFFIAVFYILPVITFFISIKSGSLFNRFKSLFKTTIPSSPLFTPGFFFIFIPLVALGVFHLWQNALWLGSPLAMLIYARTMNASIWQWQFNPSELNLLRLVYPLTVSFLNSPQSMGNITPLFVGLLPFLLVGEIRRNIWISLLIRYLLIATLVTLAAWVILFFTVVEIRYVLFLWVLLFLVLAKIMESTLDVVYRAVRPLMNFLSVLLLSFIIVRIGFIAITAYSPVDRNGEPHCSDFPLCSFFEPINQYATPGDRVLVLNAYRYYLRPDLFTCSSRSGEYEPLMSFASQAPGNFWEAVYQEGYRYVTFDKIYAAHSRLGIPPSPSLSPGWLKVEILSSDEQSIIYRITATAPPYSSKTVCLKVENGSWVIQTRGK